MIPVRVSYFQGYSPLLAVALGGGQKGWKAGEPAAVATAFARYLEAHLQNGALYNGVVARSRFAPEPGEEVARAIEALSVDIRELTSHTRRLARQEGVGRALAKSWHSLRDSLRK